MMFLIYFSLFHNLFVLIIRKVKEYMKFFGAKIKDRELNGVDAVHFVQEDERKVTFSKSYGLHVIFIIVVAMV